MRAQYAKTLSAITLVHAKTVLQAMGQIVEMLMNAKLKLLVTKMPFAATLKDLSYANVNLDSLAMAPGKEDVKVLSVFFDRISLRLTMIFSVFLFEAYPKTMDMKKRFHTAPNPTTTKN